MDKILVTGGQGFIGSYVVDNLLEKRYEVTIFDRHEDKKMWKEYGWDQEPNLHFRLGDLKDPESVFDAVNNTDRFINLAGLLGTQEMMNDPIPAIQVNIQGAVYMFEAARQYGRPGFQIAVGNYWMENPYSITKSTAVRFSQMYNKEHGTDIRACRGMNVFGPRQKHRPVRKIFPNVVIPALLDEEITIYGSGNQVMDLIYAEDIAEIIVRVSTYDNIPNDVLYEAGVGSYVLGEPMTINRAVEMIMKLTNSQAQINRVAMRPGEEKESIVEISKEGWENLEKYLHFTPDDLTPLELAMEKSIQWYAENLERFEWDG